MAGVKGRSGKGSGGAGRGQGRKRSRVVLERGMVVSLARRSNDREVTGPLATFEIVSVGGEAGHDQQLTLVGSNETITIFID